MATLSGNHAATTGTGIVRYNRSRRSEFAIWWREIDRVLLTLILAVMAIGTAAVAAASPASARRLSTAATHLDDLHFFILHLRWQLIGLIVMLGASCLPKDAARRAGIVLGAAAICWTAWRNRDRKEGGEG